MIFIDTNVFLYAAGKDHPLRAPCQAFLRHVIAGRIAAVTSSEVVQEILYVLTRRGLKIEALALANQILHLFPGLLSVTREDMEAACCILQKMPSVSVRDAVHIGVMRNRGLDRIISADRHFDNIPGFTRIDPATWKPQF
jgi:predicted nucleic acid-binding protein